MWFKHSMSIAQQLIPFYNTTVHSNKTYVALNVVKLFVILSKLTTPTGHNGRYNRRSFSSHTHNKIQISADKIGIIKRALLLPFNMFGQAMYFKS